MGTFSGESKVDLGQKNGVSFGQMLQQFWVLFAMKKNRGFSF